MADINLERILEKRVKFMIRFFYRPHIFGILLLFLVLGGCGYVSYTTVGNENPMVHLITGTVTVVAFLLFLLSILVMFNKNLSSEEVDALIAHDRSVAYEGLFENLVIENNKGNYQTDPIEVVCPDIYPNRKPVAYRYFKKSNKVYYSHIGYTWLFFGENSLYYHHSSINHIYGGVDEEVSCEFNYKDIVSVQTTRAYEKGIRVLVLSISLVNGEVFDIPLRIRPNRISDATYQLTEKEASIISTIRKVVRKSK